MTQLRLVECTPNLGDFKAEGTSSQRKEKSIVSSFVILTVVLRADALPEFFLLLHSANGKFCVSESHLLLNLVLNQAVDEDCPLGRRRGRKWPWSCCGGSRRRIYSSCIVGMSVIAIVSS